MIQLETQATPFGTVTVFQSRQTGSLIYSQGDCYQSEVDSRGVSLAPYIHALFGLILQTPARHVLMIGCGGGSLGTMLDRANRRVSIVDVNACAFDLARRHFNLPADISCHVADGREFILHDDFTYDALVLDAFHGDRIPAHLQALDFFRNVRRRLNPAGYVLVNAHIGPGLEDPACRIADCMSDVWTAVRILDLPGEATRNAIVMAGRIEGLGPPSLIMPPAIGAKEIEDELAALRFRSD
jgi:spermidine synthase